MAKRKLILTNRPLNAGGLLLITNVEDTETGELHIVQYISKGKFKILSKNNNILFYEEYISHPNTYSKYRHFKGKEYSVIGIVTDDNNNEYVLYQALYGENKCYIRPIDMFLSETDKVKYPEATQKYRFEYIQK